MTLIKSISGIRGTIGGKIGSNLTPIDIVECALGYGWWIIQKSESRPKIVIGRDGRMSGPLVNELVVQTLVALGIDVVDLGLSTTPTVEMAVSAEAAQGGIIITASHNPKQWNALKFLNDNGEIISAKDGEDILDIIKKQEVNFAEIEQQGMRITNDTYINHHIRKIHELDLVDVPLVAAQNYKVIVDCINSTGAISIGPLLDSLGCEYQLLNSEMTGDFAHNPEPLEKNLTQLIEAVSGTEANLGIAVDPDVDRLAFVDGQGNYIGEEYTIVAIADYILSQSSSSHSVVSNMSSSVALKMVAEGHGSKYTSSPVGEVNVVQEMKKSNAIFGGEGNGGVIYPELHYGRDALVGIALLLTYMAKSNKTLAELRESYPDLIMIKEKISLNSDMDVENLLSHVQAGYPDKEVDDRDGVKVWFGNDWVHLRKSNTEPIIRLYVEASSEMRVKELSQIIRDRIVTFV